MYNRLIIIHYHEIGLKGGNRAWFERHLLRNVEHALKGLPHGGVRRISGRLLLCLHEDSPVSAITDRLRYVFGIAYVSEAVAVRQEMGAIKEAAWDLLQTRAFISFKVETKRSNKAFPLTSPQINAEVGAYLKERSGARVDLDHPDLTCSLEIVEKYALLSVDRIDGPGGLPVGVSEKAVVLLSSGIDSPVASYRMMKRGVTLVFVHFHSAPYTSKASQRNAERLVHVLTRYQFTSVLYLVPFIDIQREIMIETPTPSRVILYRRAMVRLATLIARCEGAAALVTGENIGQVASQTLSNIAVIEEMTPLPILRPLAGDDKGEIIRMAQRIDTYDISIEPYEDCCSLFVPEHPETRANLEEVKAVESRLDLEALIQKAIDNAERKMIEWKP
ncbi:MAG: tRNA 4-thiouridine(8) synthase ThiI [Candidatus Latescibacteria bacterium]|nr:tRNA 4-thiouridine(8) synthase ThiI [Candidatus Latescibacterota bacterium]